MFTLLAEQQKKHLYREYRLRLLSFIAFFISALLLASAALLLPSRIMLSFETKALTSEMSVYEASVATQNSKGLLNTLDNIKSMAKLAIPDEGGLAVPLALALAKRPPDVSVASIAYTRGVGAPSSITLQGIAKTRASLISFFKILQQEKTFSASNLPVSSLAKESDIAYTINLQGKF